MELQTIKQSQIWGISILLLIWLFYLPLVTTAQSYLSKTGHAEFASRVPLHTFTGRSDNLVGFINLADSTVDFYLDVTTLKTGIGKRDKDMRLALDSQSYPFAEFFGKIASPVDQTLTTDQHIRVEGNFTIHGATRPLAVNATIRIGDQTLDASAKWELSLTDYNIEPPRLVILKVQDTQELFISTTLIRIPDDHLEDAK